jgi:N4-gp56 family major capsid protein
MAKTTFSTSNALTKKAWEEKLFRDTKKEAYFSRFMGMGSDSVVQVKNEFLKNKGDLITFGIRMRLAGSGVTSGQTLEGNEESLVTYSHTVSLEQYRHAVRDNGALDRQRAMFSIDAESKDALKGWGGEKIDQLAFDAITASPTKIFYGGDATSTSDLDSADKITPGLISKVRVWCVGGGGRTQTPIRPVRIGGKSYFVMLVHPDVAYDLKLDSTYAQANREARERGSSNPLFTGALGIWDGVVIHEHENIPIVTNWGAGSDQPGAQNVFMGAQALVWAWGKKPSVVAKNFDYENEHGYAWGMICGTNKPKFNSKDYGSVAVYTYRTAIN